MTFNLKEKFKKFLLVSGLWFLIIFSIGSSISYTSNFKIPFDFVTISLTLAGFLIIGGSWRDGQKELFEIGKAYLYSGLSFILFYVTLPFLVDSSGSLASELQLVNIPIAFLFGAALLLGILYFSVATYELASFLKRSNARKLKIDSYVTLSIVGGFLILIIWGLFYHPITIQPTVHDIKILSFAPNQKIYSPNDVANVSFIVENTASLSYNFSVYWFYNDTRNFGWSNYTEGSYSRRAYYAYYKPIQKGHWRVQVLLFFKDSINNSFTREEITEFEVI